MPQLITITLYEHESQKYVELGDIGKETLQEHFLKLNEYFEDNLKKNLEKNPSNDNPDIEEEIDESKAILEVYSTKVKARHYVGFAAVGNILIQILPKVFKPREDQTQTLEETWKSLLAFIRMLDRAYGLKIKEHDLAYIQGRKLHPSLYEVFIYLFAKSLWEEIQRGYYREYVELHSEEKFLRGKLLLSKQIRKLPHQRHTFSVEIHELMEDNLLNRIFYASVMEAMRRTSWSTNKKRLGELMLVFENITPIRLRAEHFERVHFTRLNNRFKKPFELAKLLFMPASGRGRNREVSGFFVDMNRLFELFIVSALSRYAREHGYKLTTNKDPENKGKLFSCKPKKVTLKNQYPDYILHLNNGLIILDAKYTELIKKDNSNKTRIELTSDIARQLYVYSRIWGYKNDNRNCESDSRPPAVIIVPSSSTYNRELSENLLEFEFFDGRKLYIVTYNMDSLRERAVHEADRKFIQELRRILNG